MKAPDSISRAKRLPIAEAAEAPVHERIFRDPTGTAERRKALKLTIARALLRVPSLPIDLPAFGLRLLDVDTDKKAVTFTLGREDPLAELRITANRDPFAPDVRLTELYDEKPEHQSAYSKILQRVPIAVTESRWEVAAKAAAELRRLPSDIRWDFWRQLVPGVGSQKTGLVRVGFRCNQDCGMCWQGRDWGTQSSDTIVAWIEDLASAGATALIISGGEPMLDRSLPDYVRRARELGFRDISLETNAIGAARAGFAKTLYKAGLRDVFVSLHSGDAETSDRITRAPGTFVRTIEGIRRLLDAGVAVRLNAVATAEGLEHLPGLPDFIVDTFGNHRCLKSLMLSYPADPYGPGLVAQVVPEPPALRRVLRLTIDRAVERGLPLADLGGPCGPPLCAFGADPRAASLAPVPGPVDFRAQVAECAGCGVRAACFGVRSMDVERFGAGCVLPLQSAPEPCGARV